MTFHEKSAWIMGILLVVIGGWYLNSVWDISREMGETAPPLLPRTRYTVRKQIESIEPTQWLKRFGKVRIRELKRQESARPR